MGHAKFLVEREERATRALAEYAAQERELARMQGFVDRMGAKASKATQAQDRIKKIEKLESQMNLPAFAEAEGGRGPALTLAKPPPCGMYPLTLTDASFGYAAVPGADGKLVPATEMKHCVVRDASLKLEKGARLIVRGPNGAGKSTLLNAIAGLLPLAEGTRLEDSELSLGLFAQDLAQDLPQDESATEYGEIRFRVCTGRRGRWVWVGFGSERRETQAAHPWTRLQYALPPLPRASTRPSLSPPLCSDQRGA